MHTGLGRIRVFNDRVRRGVNVVEDYIYKAIEFGCELTIINAVTRKNGKEELYPTVTSYTHIDVLIAEAYKAVQEGYGFFNEVAENDDFQKWLYAEMRHRIRTQSVFVDRFVENDIVEANKIINKRIEDFDIYTKRHSKTRNLNAAQQRAVDLRIVRELARKSWDRKTADYRLMAEFDITEKELARLRKTVMYLREIRGLIITSRKDAQIIKWIERYEGKEDVFADRMGILEEVAKALFSDILLEVGGDKDIESTNCERKGQKGFADSSGVVVCPLCESKYHRDYETGFLIHP